MIVCASGKVVLSKKVVVSMQGLCIAGTYAQLLLLAVMPLVLIVSVVVFEIKLN